jgi:hypothetical protein
MPTHNDLLSVHAEKALRNLHGKLSALDHVQIDMASGAEILRPGRGAASLPALVWAVFFCDALPPMNANRASLVILSLIEPALAAPPETLRVLRKRFSMPWLPKLYVRMSKSSPNWSLTWR